MKTMLFWFSGTGNSLAAAHRLASLLGDTTLVSVGSLVKGTAEFAGESATAVGVGARRGIGGAPPLRWSPEPEAFGEIDLSEYDRVGFIFPVYYLDLPELVKGFVQSLTFAPSRYLFAVATFGERQGSALHRLDRLLRRKGVRLDAGFELKMPGNSIAFPTEAVERRELLDSMEIRIGEIAEHLRSTNEYRTGIRHNPLPFAVSRVIRRFFRSRRGIAGRTISEDCSGCGRCGRLCPAAAVAVTDGRAQFGGVCFECFACIHWCPAGAIRFGTLKSEGDRAYRHPDIRWRDLPTPKASRAEIT